MSLTETEHVFAGPHEGGVNDFLTAFFTSRPRHRAYASFLPTSLVVTNIPPISFPGAAPIHYAVVFSVPVVDFHPDSSGGMPPPLSLPPEALSIRTTVTLILLCQQRQEAPTPATHVPPPAVTPLISSLEVWGVGRPVVQYFGPGVGNIGFEVEAVELVDVQPDHLETLLECLIRMLLNASLSQVRVPFRLLDAGWVTLALQRGPLVADDRTKVYGDLV